LKKVLLHLYEFYGRARIDADNPMARHARRVYNAAIQIIEGHQSGPGENAEQFLMQVKEKLLKLQVTLSADPDDEYTAGAGAGKDALVIIDKNRSLLTDFWQGWNQPRFLSTFTSVIACVLSKYAVM
jgi:hypothetical protein